MLQKHGKALVIYVAAHFYRTAPSDYLASMGEDIGMVRMLEKDYPGRTLAVIPVGGRIDLPPGVTLGVYPDYQKFDRALKTQVRPVPVPLQRLPFRDFTKIRGQTPNSRLFEFGVCPQISTATSFLSS